MSSPMNRRDFLKLAALAPLSAASSPYLRLVPPAASADKPNVIVVVFDALSAYHVSLLGYSRETTPNLARLARHAIVYHNHYAGSNFTTSGTASLLTGVLPWKHRALNGNGQVVQPYTSDNIFGLFRDYHRLAYTHNGWAYTLLRQMQGSIDDLVPREKLLLSSYDNFIASLFRNDDDIASVSWTRDMRLNEGYGYSLFLSQLNRVLQEGRIASLKTLFPRGLPTTGSDDGFLLEHAIDWLANLLGSVPQPFAGYFHFLPPHFPYRTAAEFYQRFRGDHYKPPEKPLDVFADRRVQNNLPLHRTEYDEFVLYVDREFGRFYDQLQAAGLTDSTWIILTSDHGEMFERGIMGHSTDAMYQPVIRVPLMVFEPGRETGLDVESPTSAVDVLPTLAHLSGHALPDWTEGTVLPPFRVADAERGLYVVRAHDNAADAPLTVASTTLVRGRYKLLYYFGFQPRGIEDFVRLYDVEADPEELTDLSATEKDIAGVMLNELRNKLAEVNQPNL